MNFKQNFKYVFDINIDYEQIYFYPKEFVKKSFNKSNSIQSFRFYILNYQVKQMKGLERFSLWQTLNSFEEMISFMQRLFSMYR